MVSPPPEKGNGFSLNIPRQRRGRKKKYLSKGVSGLKRRIWELCKTLVIVLLLCSAALLSLTAAEYSGWDISPLSWLTAGDAPPQPPKKAQKPSLSDAASPLVVSVRGYTGRTSFWGASADLEHVYESLGGYLAEALDTAGEPGAVGSEAFLEAAAAQSIYFRFPGEVPLRVLAAWLDGASEAEISADRFLLSVTAESVRLLVGGAAGYYVMDTRTDPETLERALGEYSGDGTRFAMETADVIYARLDPLALVDPSVTDVAAAQSVNPCDDAFLAAAATALGFNPYGDSGYRDTAGNTVFTETDCSLRADANGLLVLRNPSLASRFSAGENHDGARIEYVRSLLELLSSGRLGDAKLQFTGLEEKDGRTRIEFSYILGGLPVKLSSGAAAEAWFSGAVLEELRFQVRVCTLSRTARIALLPVAQAAVILKKNADLQPAYFDAGVGPMTAGWSK